MVQVQPSPSCGRLFAGQLVDVVDVVDVVGGVGAWQCKFMRKGVMQQFLNAEVKLYRGVHRSKQYVDLEPCMGQVLPAIVRW